MLVDAGCDCPPAQHLGDVSLSGVPVGPPCFWCGVGINNAYYQFTTSLLQPCLMELAIYIRLLQLVTSVSLVVRLGAIHTLCLTSLGTGARTNTFLSRLLSGPRPPDVRLICGLFCARFVYGWPQWIAMKNSGIVNVMVCMGMHAHADVV